MVSEEEKYQRKSELLKRAFLAADKMDKEDAKKEAAEKLKATTHRALKRKAAAEQKEKDGKKAEQDAEPVID